MNTFVAYPLLAFALGGIFVGAWLWRDVRSAAIAGFLWLLYGVYEYLIHARVLCSGECNIRVDLLAIYPLLLIVSVIALWNIARARRSHTPR